MESPFAERWNWFGPALSGRFRSARWTNRQFGLKDWLNVLRKKIPEGLDWDLWLGPAPKVPYSSKYVPFKWRGWWDYGTGALGDMACHIMDMPYWALDLKYPLSVEAEQGGNSEAPARTVGHPPVSRPGIQPAGHHDLVRRKEGRSSEHAPWDAPTDRISEDTSRSWSVTREPWFSTGVPRNGRLSGVTPMRNKSSSRLRKALPMSSRTAFPPRTPITPSGSMESKEGELLFQFRSCRSAYGDRFVGQLGRADRSKDRLGRSVDETGVEKERFVRRKYRKGWLVSFLVEGEPRTVFLRFRES